MLPVQVKSVSSSSCTLSEASALLQCFLSSDGCSDSFARDYVANVAQALQDSVSRRSGSPESKGNTAPSPPHSKLRSHGMKNLLVAKKFVPSGLGDAHTDEKPSLSSAEDGDASMEVRSVMPEAEHAFERHKKKRGHSAVENGLETDLPCTSEIENLALMHHDNKRRKKEKNKTATESVIKELYGPDDQRQHDRKRRKEKQEMETKIVETDHPALDNRGSDGKRRRMKEKQGKDTEDMETLHVPENTGSLISLSHAKKKVEVSHMDANNVRVSVTPMSGKVDELTGYWKVGKMFPSATPSLEKEEREETDMEASPVEFENPASDEKKRTKKKRRRKELGD